jgi:putative transposase
LEFRVDLIKVGADTHPTAEAQPTFGLIGRRWMAKYRRNFVPGGTYFFTVVTEGRRPFLTDELARRILRDAMRRIRAQRPFTIDAFVLLPDHLHAVWTLPADDAAYPLRWKRIKERFTSEFLASAGEESIISASRSYKGERGVWQRRYYEHTVRDEADLKRCIDYIHINPLKHGLVDCVADWPWSSFHRYVALGEYSLGWGSDATFYGDEWLQYE